MRPTERVIDVDSTLSGEKIRMGFDESSVQHIIGVLTDLYSDQELAVIREYSTNALDAHREAGNPMPVEVTTPTNLAPFFRVKDYGVGLGAEEIRDIYSRYGTSTKRDSDEQVGMLGLGAKSALTYSDQFTLIGTKDGRTVQVSIGRDEDGGGSMTIVSDEPSDAANGVEIIVPVKRDNKFEQKAKAFFRFWTPGTVLLNGEEPSTIAAQADPTWLVPDKLFVFDPEKLTDGPGYNRYSDTSSPGWVVMGNVPYPMPDESNMRGRKYRVVAFVDIGEVNFTPSREALMLTKRTKETLAQIEADVARELANAAQKRVAGAENPADAIRLTQEAAAWGVKTADLKYQGKEIPTKLERGKIMNSDGKRVDAVGALENPKHSWLVLGTTQYRSRKNGERYRELPPYNSSRIVFTGYESKELSLTKRQKLDAWYKQQGIETPPKQVVFVDELSADERFWLTGTPIHDWSPVQEIKLPKDEKAMVGPGWKQRPRGSYKLAGTYDKHIPAEDIDTAKPLLYLHTYEQQERFKLAQQYQGDATVVVVPANRHDKFLRDFPQALRLTDYIKKEAQTWLKKQDAALVEAAKYALSGKGDGLTKLDPDRIDDPELEGWVRLAKTNTRDILLGIEKRRGLLDGFDRYELARNYPDPLSNYPLLENQGYGKLDIEHAHLYVNAAYAA
jgi:hypothetical protein